MTQEDRSLLLKDLCARLPYHVIIEYRGANVDLPQYARSVKIEDCKPYLRPMSSMTEEEYEIYHELIGGMFGTGILINLPILEDFLNKNMFDYRGLIDKGLALKAPEGMYNIKEK